MGGAKRALEEADQRLQIGIEIGICAGVLERCPLHEECYWETREDKTEAYKVASAMMRDGDPIVDGADRQDVLDGVKAAIAEAGIDGCAHCGSHMDD